FCSSKALRTSGSKSSFITVTCSGLVENPPDPPFIPPRIISTSHVLKKNPSCETLMIVPTFSPLPVKRPQPERSTTRPIATNIFFIYSSSIQTHHFLTHIHTQTATRDSVNTHQAHRRLGAGFNSCSYLASSA